MFVDIKSRVSNSQAITASAASTDDLKTQGNQPGQGDRLAFNIVVGEAFTAAGAATLTIGAQYQVDGTNWVDMNAIGPIGKADLVVGKQLKLPVVGDIPTPSGVNVAKIRLYYTVATGPMTAGKVTAWLAAD
jgi:hypothetical protein